MKSDISNILAYISDTPPDRFTFNAADRPEFDSALLQRAIQSLRPAPVARKSRQVITGAYDVILYAGVLLTAVRRVMAASDQRGTVPVLTGVRITVDNGMMTLDCTDLDISISESVRYDGSPFACCVPVKTLYKLLQATPSTADVTFSYTAPSGGKNDTGSLIVNGARMTCLHLADFPNIATSAKFDTFFTLPIDALRNALNFVAPAMSTEQTRYYLNSVLLAKRLDGSLDFVATDGHRLHRYNYGGYTGPDIADNVIVPTAAVKALQGLMAKASDLDSIDVSLCGNKFIRFRRNTVTITSKLIDGTFPAYDRVVPNVNDLPLVTEINREALTAAVKAVTAMSSDRSAKCVKLEVCNGNGHVSFSDPEHGSAIESVQVVNWSSQFTLTVGINAKYLADAVGGMSDNPVFRWETANAPMRVEDSADPAKLAVIIPIRL